MTYHLKEIKRGRYGESSKILEEVFELIDSEEQNCKIMAINELSDIVGAIDGYLKHNYPQLTLHDLIKMSDITHIAFISGRRT